MPFKLHKTDSAHRWKSSRPVKLVWTDPPFGTDKWMKRGDNSYRDIGRQDAASSVEHAIQNIPLTDDAVVCVCADYRIIHHIVWRLTELSERRLYHQGDVIWTFGLGRPRTNWWPNRHNTIATFTVTKDFPPFDASVIPREARKAPKAGYEGDKPAGSVWDHTMSNTSAERVGYPNQKPLAIIEPFVLAHTKPGDIVADPFMGSGSVGVAALKNKRNFIGQDINPEALKTARERLETL